MACRGRVGCCLLDLASLLAVGRLLLSPCASQALRGLASCFAGPAAARGVTVLGGWKPARDLSCVLEPQRSSC